MEMEIQKQAEWTRKVIIHIEKNVWTLLDTFLYDEEEYEEELVT